MVQLVGVVSWSGWSGWSDGLGGPGDPGGPAWVLKGPKSAGFFRVKKVDTFQSNIKVSLTVFSRWDKSSQFF